MLLFLLPSLSGCLLLRLTGEVTRARSPGARRLLSDSIAGIGIMY